jgi:site-specific recombinase XerD
VLRRGSHGLNPALNLLRSYNAVAAASPFLLPQLAGHDAGYEALRKILARAARKANCSTSPSPHCLRHT